MTQKTLAFIGLGVMGYPMAGHLARADYRVRVFNRTRDKAQRWASDYPGTAFDTPRDAAQGADIVFVCVGNDDDVRSVIYGDEGVLAGMKSGAVLVDHTTTSATLAEELADACCKQETAFIDAPVSGGQAGAENGALTIMCGANEPDVYQRVEPVLHTYARQCQLMGRAGQGQRCKMVNQVCITGILQGLSEGLILAEQAGLDIDQMVSVLEAGAAGSWQMSNRARTMAAEQFDFGFAIDWMRKDLAIALDEARHHGVDLPLAAQTDQAYARLQDKGHGRSDTSALILDRSAQGGVNR